MAYLMTMSVLRTHIFVQSHKIRQLVNNEKTTTGIGRCIIGVLTESSPFPSVCCTSLSSALPYITPQPCKNSVRHSTCSDKNITFANDKLDDSAKGPQGYDTVSTGGSYKCNHRHYHQHTA